MHCIVALLHCIAAGLSNNTYCACSRACNIDSILAEEAGFMFYTRSNTELIGDKLSVLEKNSVYRMHDILVHSGIRFRRDSISVLCEPLYRGTLLRDVLVTTSLVDGVPFSQQLESNTKGPKDLEWLIAQRGDGLQDPNETLAAGNPGNDGGVHVEHDGDGISKGRARSKPG